MNGGKLKISHIINPVLVSEDRELHWQQPITYSTMFSARRFAKKEFGLDVELFATTYPEDEGAVPEGFTRTKNLTRSIQDIREFPLRRKLPLFKDILDRLYESTEADYLIQTNVDIGLMPHFYASVARFINLGYDAFIINKRIISNYYRRVDQIPDMWSEMGTDHNGYDCFVFRRDLYPKFYMGDNCMGIPWSETSLAANMIAFSKNCRVFKQVHLTFHIGDSRTWIPQEDYRRFNTEAFCNVLTYLVNSGYDITHHEIIAWLLKKLRYELKPDYPKVCHDLVARLSYLF
jgi:hypothetical protein